MSVTASQELCKQPVEKRRFSMEFANLMSTSTGEEITSINDVSSETIDEDTSDLTITAPSIIDGNATNSRVQIWIEDGTAGLKYRIQITVTTTDGQILAGDGLLTVRDR